LLPLLKKLKGTKKQTVREANVSINAAERQQYFNKFTSKPMWQLKLFVFVNNIIYTTLSNLNIVEEMKVAAKKVEKKG
jgi:hypothetical protein